MANVVLFPQIVKDTNNPHLQRVQNNTNVVLHKCKLVTILSATPDGFIGVRIADGNFDQVYGLIATPISPTFTGYVAMPGSTVTDIDTSMWAPLTQLYCDDDGNLTADIIGDHIATVTIQDNKKGAIYLIPRFTSNTTIPTVPETDAVVVYKNCLASAQVGDLVYDSNASNAVDVAPNNINVKPVFGIIIEKTSLTTCKVLLNGEMTVLSSLVEGRKVFLSTTGEITSTPPNTGYVQCLGVAVGTDRVYFNPQLVRVKRN